MKPILILAVAVLLMATSSEAELLFDGSPAFPVPGNLDLDATEAVVAAPFFVTATSPITGFRVRADQPLSSPGAWDGTAAYSLFATQIVTGIARPSSTPLATGNAILKARTFAGVHLDVDGNARTVWSYVFYLEAPISLDSDTLYWIGLHLSNNFTGRDLRLGPPADELAISQRFSPAFVPLWRSRSGSFSDWEMRTDGQAGIDLQLYNGDCPDGVVDTTEACDDGNGNDFDCCRNSCEHPACLSSRSSSIDIYPERGRFKWKWTRGDSTTIYDLYPRHESYRLCLYAGTAEPQIIEQTRTNATWITQAPKVSYSHASGGARFAVSLTASSMGKSKAKIVNTASFVAIPEVPFTVRFINGDKGTCLQATYDAASVKQIHSGRLKAVVK